MNAFLKPVLLAASLIIPVSALADAYKATIDTTDIFQGIPMQEYQKTLASANAKLPPVIPGGRDRSSGIDYQPQNGGVKAVVATDETGKIATKSPVQIFTIAFGKPNRLITPWNDMVVVTDLEESEYELIGSAIYITPGYREPVTMHITKRGDSTSGITLTLTPADIPAQVIEVRPVQNSLLDGDFRQAEELERNNDHVALIGKVMHDIAKGGSIEGFSLRKHIENDGEVSCTLTDHSGADIRMGQVATGMDYSVYIMAWRNPTDRAIAIRPETCRHSKYVISAVSSMGEYLTLPPKTETELYVATKRKVASRFRRERVVE